jgi:uncharacterized RDD family membrane protein YckC
MTRFTRWLTALAACLALTAPLAAPLAAQDIHIAFNTGDNPTLRILQDYTLPAGNTTRNVVVIGGDAKIDGTVDEDVVVILGKAQVGAGAVVDGSFVVVGGSVEVADGARIGRDFVVIGGATTGPDFRPGGQHVVIGTMGLGENLRALVPWLTRGLLLGRPIVPSLYWVWIVAGIFFLLNLVLNVLFDRPVRTSTETLRATPFSAFMAGLLVLLLFGPICVLLAVSVIGVVVIPFVLCAILAAGVLGRIAFARWLGMSVLPQSDPADRAQSMRSFLIGSVLMCVAYMIPFVGFIVWSLAGVFGLGAATLAFYTSYRRENPKPPKKTVPPPAPPADTTGVRIEPDDAAAAAVLVPLDVPADAGSVSDAALSDAAVIRPGGAFAYPKATFMERLGALALDAIAIGILVNLLDFDRPFHSDRFVLLLALAYHVGFWTWRQTTLGGMICQLRVVRTDGKPLEFPEALVRGIVGIISLAVVGLGFFWILRDPERQAWHDRVAGTYVVKAPRTALA